MRPLRLEAYDPDATDGDGDGIVQDGTAWERPVGTRILDELGREIVRGHKTGTHPKNLSYVDKHGKKVDYTPKHAREVPSERSSGSRTALERIGHSSIGKRTAPTIGSKRPGLGDLGHSSIVDRHDPPLPKPPSPGKKPKAPEVSTPVAKVQAAYRGKEGLVRLLQQHLDQLLAADNFDLARADEPNQFMRGDGDGLVELVAKLQGGFDGLPIPISAEEARRLDAAGAERVYRAIDEPSFVEALRTGPYRAGTGMWGSGIYTSPDADWVQDFTKVKIATGKDISQHWTQFYLDPDARVISFTELRQMQQEMMRALDEVPELRRISEKYRDHRPNGPAELAEFDRYFAMQTAVQNYGRLAALLGYDAVEIRQEQAKPQKERALARGHEIVILNRTALRLPPQPSDFEWRAIAREQHATRLAARTERLGTAGTTEAAAHTGIDGLQAILRGHEKDIAGRLNPDLTANDAFFGQPDEALRAIVKLQGFDGLPVPVKKAEVRALEEARAPVVYRALDDAEHAADLRRGPYWPGTGIHGAGIYVAPNADVVGDYTVVELASHPNPGQHWTQFFIDPSARTVTIEELRRILDEEVLPLFPERPPLTQEQRDFIIEIAKIQDREPVFPDPNAGRKIVSDYGRLAALLGYDVIVAGEGPQQEYVVLNRGALRLPPQPSRAGWRRIGADARAAMNASS